MNHDATHCFEYTKACPKSFYRAQLTEDLYNRIYQLPVSWAHFKGTGECPKWPNNEKTNNKGGRYEPDRES